MTEEKVKERRIWNEEKILWDDAETEAIKGRKTEKDSGRRGGGG